MVAALSMALVTTQVMAGTSPASPGGTPGAPNKGATPTGTLEAGHGQGPQGPQGPKSTPGAQATAQAGLHGAPAIYRGTITAVDATSLTLALADGSSITLGLTQDTRIKVPGPQANGDTLLIGMHVVVMAFPDANNNMVARFVIAIPGAPTLTHRVGTVTAYTAGSSITIQATDDNAYTFSLTSDTKILPPGLAETLAVGSRVTIIATRDPSTLGWTATGIVVHPPLP